MFASNFKDWRLDTRSLALFRILLGSTLLTDLYFRSWDIRAHYTDFGLLPLSTWNSLVFAGEHVSLHALFGDLWWQQSLFVLSALALTSFLFGFYTRLSGVIAWVLLLSMQHRNPYILQGGDVLLRLSLLFANCLPVAEWFSVDAWRKKALKPVGAAAFFPSLFFALQLASMYWFTYWMKSGPAWQQNENAVYLALSLPSLATPFAIWLRQFSTFLPFLTDSVLTLESFGPLLLFIPGRFAAKARLLAVFIFMAFHIGLLLCLKLGPFPYACLATWCAFLPASFWNNFLPASNSVETQSDHVTAFCFFLLCYGTSWNFNSVGVSWKLWGQDFIATAFGMDQGWSMFGPSPPIDDAWYVASGTMQNGSTVDVIPVAIREPNWVAPAELGSTERWRKYYMTLREPRRKMVQEAYAAYLCRVWNENRESEFSLKQFDLYAMIVPIGYGEHPSKKVLLVHQVCF